MEGVSGNSSQTQGSSENVPFAQFTKLANSSCRDVKGKWQVWTSCVSASMSLCVLV